MLTGPIINTINIQMPPLFSASR